MPHVAAAGAALMAACLVAPDTAADVQSAAYSGATSFVYKLKHMPDFDQKRATAPNLVGLPNDGKMYCVPTAMMNIFAYAANHGFPNTAPGPGWWQSQLRYNQAGTAIAQLGALMGTDPLEGTGGAGAAFGTMAWLSPTSLTFTRYEANGFWSPKIEDLAYAAINNQLVALCYGRYTMLVPGSPNLIGPRDGGHCVTLVEALRSGDDIIIKIRDPGDDPDSNQFGYMTTQSAFSNRVYSSAKNRSFDILGGPTRTMTALTFPVAAGETVRLIDSAIYVRPKSGFSWQPGINNQPPKIVFQIPSLFFGSGGLNSQVIELLVGQSIVDATPSPEQSSTLALVTQAGAPVTLRRVDHTTGEQATLANVPGATDLVLGRKRELYVLSSERLECFDVDADNGMPTATVFPPGPCVAMCFDDERDEIVLLSPSQRKIFRYRERLPAGVPPHTTCIPAGFFMGSDGWIDIHPADGKAWFATAGNDTIYHVPDHPTCEPMVQTISMAQIIRPRSLSFDDAGHMFVMADAGLFELQSNAAGGWGLAPQPFFGNMISITTRKLLVSRSRTNFDPAIHTGPGFRNIDPDELDDDAPIEPDCLADLNGDGQVDVDDLIAVILAWGPCTVCLADTNDDRVIDVDDLITVILSWGLCP
jgi:hypothetical protein